MTSTRPIGRRSTRAPRRCLRRPTSTVAGSRSWAIRRARRSGCSASPISRAEGPMAEAGEHEHHHDHEHEHEHHHHEHVSYPEAVQLFRDDKDAFFRTHPRSPVPEAERASFAGIPYYPVDEDLRFDDLRLEPYGGEEPVFFQIPTSDGKLRPAERAGVLRFPLGAAERTLTAYRFEGQPP